MSAVETLANLAGLVTSLVNSSNPTRAKGLQDWIEKGGLESLKPTLLTFLKCKTEAPKLGAVCTLEGKIAITIVPQFGENLNVNIEPSTTVVGIKGIIEDLTGIPVVEQRLIYQDGKELDNDQNMLESYHRGGAANIVMLTLARHTIPIYAGPDSGVSIDVTIDTTVGDARDLVEAASGIAKSKYRLSLDNVLMTDDQFIYDSWVASDKHHIRMVA